MSKRVLVIDDDEAVRKSFCLALEDTAYSVTTAESGERGILETEKNRFDIIFLDLKMPGLNGVETLRKIRQSDSQVPVYIVTAFHNEFFEQLKGVARDGIHFQVLQKPIGMDQIVSVARSVLEGPLSV